MFAIAYSGSTICNNRFFSGSVWPGNRRRTTERKKERKKEGKEGKAPRRSQEPPVPKPPAPRPDRAPHLLTLSLSLLHPFVSPSSFPFLSFSSSSSSSSPLSLFFSLPHRPSFLLFSPPHSLFLFSFPFSRLSFPPQSIVSLFHDRPLPYSVSRSFRLPLAGDRSFVTASPDRQTVFDPPAAKILNFVHPPAA